MRRVHLETQGYHGKESCSTAETSRGGTPSSRQKVSLIQRCVGEVVSLFAFHANQFSESAYAGKEKWSGGWCRQARVDRVPRDSPTSKPQFARTELSQGILAEDGFLQQRCWDSFMNHSLSGGVSLAPTNDADFFPAFHEHWCKT